MDRRYFLKTASFRSPGIITADILIFDIGLCGGIAAKNCLVTESSWEMYQNVFPYFIKNVPQVVDGFVSTPEGPGLVIDFSDEPFENRGAQAEIIGELYSGCYKEH